jgi:hypothetical protein
MKEEINYISLKIVAAEVSIEQLKSFSPPSAEQVYYKHVTMHELQMLNNILNKLTELELI